MSHAVKIIAVNDRYISEEVIAAKQQENEEMITVQRYSSKLNWNEKIQRLNAVVQFFEPQWISLQYVPYGYNRKGVPFYLPGKLSAIKSEASWHIMFHEMWIGISKSSPLKHKLYGFFQKKIALSLVRRLTPGCLHTSNFLYQAIQKNMGISSSILPLFSNIAYHYCNENEKGQLLQELGIGPAERNSLMIIGIFGHLYSTRRIYSTIESECMKAREEGKKLMMISFGKVNPAEVDTLKKIQAKYPEVQVKQLGIKPEKEVSCMLQLLDKGLSCTPYELIGKSGAFAAMRRHNVPVLIPRTITVPEYEDEVDVYNAYLNRRPSAEWDVSFISKQFEQDLLQAHGH